MAAPETQSHLTDEQLPDLLRNRVYGHVLPTRVQAKLAAWDHLKYYAEFAGGVPNESELRVDYPGGHRVQLFGGDEPTAARPAFSGLSLDEFGMQRPNIFWKSCQKTSRIISATASSRAPSKARTNFIKRGRPRKARRMVLDLADINQSLATERTHRSSC